MKIDVHNHVLPREVLELFKTDPAFGTSLKEKRIDIRGFAFPLSEAFYDPQAKLHELEQHELDAAVVSIAPPSFLYELAADKTQILCAAANAGLARFAKHAPDRFRWMAHVPMLTPDHAIAMLKQAKVDGAVGVQITTSIAGRRLDDAMFDGFWAIADELNLLVMIHPWYNSSYPGLEDWYFQNVIGNPLETMIAGCRLICSGLLDRANFTHSAGPWRRPPSVPAWPTAARHLGSSGTQKCEQGPMGVCRALAVRFAGPRRESACLSR
jgi:aminocarboxymuconate-semialdehyde decarboxylase